MDVEEIKMCWLRGEVRITRLVLVALEIHNRDLTNIFLVWEILCLIFESLCICLTVSSVWPYRNEFKIMVVSERPTLSKKFSIKVSWERYALM